VMSIFVSLIAGWILLIGVTAAIQNYDAEALATVPAAQIFIDAAGGGLGQFLLLIAIGAQFYCGMSSVTANSRMIYAFSRDGAIPGHRFWHKVNKRTGTPTNSIWLATVGAFVLWLPYLYNPNAYFAVISIAVIGLYVAYAIPIFLRLRAGDRFQPGPWQLGRWSRPIGIVAVTWVSIISILFVLPTVFPVTLGNLNYTIVAVAVVGLGTAIWWMVSAKHWFTGPRIQGSAEELAAIEAELSNIGTVPGPAPATG
jgi:amino acid transporter